MTTTSHHTIEASQNLEWPNTEVPCIDFAWKGIMWNRCVYEPIMKIHTLEWSLEQNIVLWWPGTWHIQVHAELRFRFRIWIFALNYNGNPSSWLEQHIAWWGGTWYIPIHTKLVVSGRAAHDLDHDFASRCGFHILQEQNAPDSNNAIIIKYQLLLCKVEWQQRHTIQLRAPKT